MSLIKISIQCFLTNHATDKMPSAIRNSEDYGNTNGTNGTNGANGFHTNNGIAGANGVDDSNGVNHEETPQNGQQNGTEGRERIVVVGLGMVALSFM